MRLEPDKLHPRIVKNMANDILKQLEIFEKSWMTDQIPKDKTQASIRPVFKEKREIGEPREL